jgi:hypothetical protein
MGPRGVRTGSLLLAAIAASFTAGCVETATYEKAARELDQTRQASLQKDQRIRALEWHLAAVTQQAQLLHQREADARREADTRARELAAATALAEKAKAEETARRASVFELPEEGPPGKKDAASRACAPLRPEDLRRLVAALDARNAPTAEAIARIEKLLREQGARPPPSKPGIDVVDPWGFGARK